MNWVTPIPFTVLIPLKDSGGKLPDVQRQVLANIFTWKATEVMDLKTSSINIFLQRPILLMANQFTLTR